MKQHRGFLRGRFPFARHDKIRADPDASHQSRWAPRPWARTLTRELPGQVTRRHGAGTARRPRSYRRGSSCLRRWLRRPRPWLCGQADRRRPDNSHEAIVEDGAPGVVHAVHVGSRRVFRCDELAVDDADFFLLLRRELAHKKHVPLTWIHDLRKLYRYACWERAPTSPSLDGERQNQVPSFHPVLLCAGTCRSCVSPRVQTGTGQHHVDSSIGRRELPLAA